MTTSNDTSQDRAPESARRPAEQDPRLLHPAFDALAVLESVECGAFAQERADDSESVDECVRDGLAWLREFTAALSAPPAPASAVTEAEALLKEAIDLVPRIDEDDPMAPALAEWCRKVIARAAALTGAAR